jgi:Streptomyces sporulation and cell division protein, SsgA
VVSVEPGCVVCETSFALVVAGSEPIHVGAVLRYDPRDPFAVCVSFDAGATERIEWTFARDLLAEGLVGATGKGDVKVWPRGDVVFVALCSPTGRAVLEAPRTTLAEFVDRTQRVVPSGSEDDFVDLDRELASLLG